MVKIILWNLQFVNFPFFQMNAQGLYDLEHAYKVAEMMKNGDEKRLVNAKKMADVCVKGIHIFKSLTTK